MTSTFWTDGYRDGSTGAAYNPPEHSATSVYTAEYQRGYNKACEDATSALSMSVGRDYRSGSAYEYVIYRAEQIVAREGFFRNYAAAKRAGLKAAAALDGAGTEG